MLGGPPMPSLCQLSHGPTRCRVVGPFAPLACTDLIVQILHMLIKVMFYTIILDGDRKNIFGDVIMYICDIDV